MASFSSLVRTSAGRIALRYAFYFSMFVAVCLLVTYGVQVSYIRPETAQAIQRELLELQALHDREGHPRLVAEVVARQTRGLADPEKFYLLQDREGRSLAGLMRVWTGVGKWKDGQVSNLWVDPIVVPELAAEERSYCPTGTTVLQDGCRLAIAQHVELNEHLRQITLPVFGSIFVMVALAGLTLGTAVGRVLLRRVEAVNVTARAVTAGDLGQRVPADGSGDEFDELGRHFNAMLDKTEQLVSGMRRVSDNVAHDLRRPLARLRSGLEVTLLEERTPGQYRDAIEAAVVQLEGVIATFHSLLQISRLEVGEASMRGDIVDLTALVAELADLYQPAVTVQPSEGAAEVTVVGDLHLIRQAISNLIENAIKFSPQGETITVTTSRTDTGATVTVSDRGPGIPESQREFVLERFARLEEARSTPGNGLGLTLVKAVANLHRAELRLQDNEPGLRVSLVFTALTSRP